MQVSVTFRHIDSKEALKEYASERVNRVKKYLDNPLEAQVVLSVEKFRHIAEITIVGDGFTFNGEESSSEDMFSAIDLVMDKIEGQARKYSKKIRDHKSASIKSGFQAAQEVPEDSFEEDEGPRVIKSKDFLAKPMSIDEAVMQLALIDNNFLVFINAGSKQINVIYKRKDGHYGLIEPN